MNRLDFTAEILKFAPGETATSDQAPVDVTGRLLLEGIGSVNRAVERDLLSFRTGDLTMRFDNHDGYFDDLFAFFNATDRWQFRLTRERDTIFHGLLVPLDSIEFDRVNREVEVTAYGLSKVLDETDAALVFRDISGISVSVGINIGDTIITLTPNTTGLLSGDVINLNDEQGSEDVTIKSVISSTQIELEAGTVGSYVATETQLTLPNPFYRFRDIEFLVRELFEVAGVPVAEFNINSALLTQMAPIDVNLNRLSENGIWAAPAERNGRAYVSIESDATFYITSAESDWTEEDSLVAPWVDWSRYYTESETGPTLFLRFHTDVPEAGGSSTRPEMNGYDFRAAQPSVYYINMSALSEVVSRGTTTDGLTWSHSTFVALPDMAGLSINYAALRHVEYDPVRNALFATWQNSAGTSFSRYYDIGGAAWSDLRTVADILAGKYYFAPVYCKDLDMVFMLYGISPSIETDFQIAAFRGTQRLWLRDFPRCFIDDETEITQAPVFPTESLRYVNGELLCLVHNNGKVRLVRTKDQFQTYEIGDLGPTGQRMLLGSRALGAYWMTISKTATDATDRKVMRAGPLSEVLVEYADFADKSVGEALGDLAALVNAHFWIDDDFQGHFVCRDLLPESGEIPAVDDQLLEDSGVSMWDESRQMVEVSGGGATGTAGDEDFVSEAFSLNSPFIPNEAYAQVIAEAMLAFVGEKRGAREIRILDADGRVFRTLDRLSIDGVRWVVYESDHEIADEEWSLTILEDLEVA